MRLLNTHTKHLEEFFEKQVPKYAILSHVWGENEVTFRDVAPGEQVPSSLKIDGPCKRAREGHLYYIWIDTVCIDKSSSAELSEAINSMFWYYQQAEECYVYLADVENDDYPSLRQSRWFTRGWTLQELLAPKKVVFYHHRWRRIGRISRRLTAKQGSDLSEVISKITDIPVKVLEHDLVLSDVVVARKMSWAAKRETTRIEDQAYCLLGMFDVNMPLLYGEREKAFQRLQEEIMKTSADHTLFSWGREQHKSPHDSSEAPRFLATSPDEFVHCKDVCQLSRWNLKLSPYTMTNIGIQISLPWLPLSDEENHRLCIVALDYTIASDQTAHGTHRKCAALPLQWDMKQDTYHRLGRDRPLLISRQAFRNAQIKSLYVSGSQPGLFFVSMFWLEIPITLPGDGLELYPLEWTYVAHGANQFRFHRLNGGKSSYVVARIAMSSRSSGLFKVALEGSWQASRIRVSLGHIAHPEPYSLVEYALQNGGEIKDICQWQNEIRLTNSTQLLSAKVEKNQAPSVGGWDFTVKLKLDTKR